MIYRLLLLCAALLVLVTSQSTPTTPFIQEVFLGKCYQRNPSGTVNCTSLWTAFSQAAQQNNYIVNATSYIPFMQLSNFSSPPNQAMLWLGNQADATLFSSKQNNPFTIMTTTSSGFVLSLSWCGTASNTFDYNNRCLYGNNVSAHYFGLQGVWNLCSQYFAQGISGHLTILVEPAQNVYNSSYLAYRNTSTLAYSLPYLSPTKVTGVTIYLLTNLTAAPFEVCNNGTLLNLTQTLTSYGFKPSCIDDNEAIYKLLCPVGATHTPQCLAALLARPTKMPEKEGLYLVWALVTTVSTAALIVLSVYFGLRVRVLESEMRII